MPMEIPSKALDKEEVINQIKANTKKDMDALIKHIITEKLRQEKDPQKLYEFFTYIYDNLYHDIIFKKIHISKQLVTILETLAIPTTYDTTAIDDILKRLKAK